MMEIKQVDIECIDVFWDRVKGWIEKVVRQTNGRHTVESTYNLLKQGTMTMFLITHKKKITAVVVTQKVYYPAKVVLGFLFIGGKKVCRYLKEIEDYFIKYAQSLGYNYHSSAWFDQAYKVLNKDYKIAKKVKPGGKDSFFKKIIDKIK